ncbi:MAG: rod shape-determining protein RodA [Bacteroidota bacterium]
MATRSRRRIDYLTISLYLALVGIGWLMIYTVGYGDHYQNGITHFLLQTTVGKQTIWIGISLTLLVFLQFIDRNFWRTFAIPVYIGAMALLVGVLLFGTEIKGAKSWFSLGGFSIQPSEFAKFATCILMAHFLSTYRVNLKVRRFQILALGILLIPMGLILLQPDAGSALVFLSFFIVLYREGFPSNFFILSLSFTTLLILGLRFDPIYVNTSLSALIAFFLLAQLKAQWFWYLTVLGLIIGTYTFLPAEQYIYLLYALLAMVTWMAFRLLVRGASRPAIASVVSLALGIGLVIAADFSFNNFLKPHQQDRINVWLNPEKCDPQGSLYNVLQSKMAIGSGGLTGKGFLEGTLTKGNYIPEQSTDFIFCTIGEEQGFVGTFAIIGLFCLLMIRIATIAERQRSNFARIYAYGVAGIIFIHFLINIGMTMGIMPIIGIPLPFISKGGSSLLGFTLLVGVLLKLDRHRYQI